MDIDSFSRYLPRLVLEEDHTEFNPPFKTEYKVIILSSDISGFSNIHRYEVEGEESAWLNTVGKTVKAYMGELMEYVLKSGGDVVKFASDELLAVWPTDHEHLKSVLAGVIVTVLWYHYQLSTQFGDTPPYLSIRTAMSLGNFTMKYIGNSIQRHYIEGGAVVHDIQTAMNMCAVNSLILSPTAASIFNKEHFVYHFMDDDEHVTISDVRHYFPECGVLKTFKQYLPIKMLGILHKKRSKNNMFSTATEKLIHDHIKPYITKLRSSASFKKRSRMRAKNRRTVAVDEIFNDTTTKRRRTRHKIRKADKTERRGSMLHGLVPGGSQASFFSAYSTPVPQQTEAIDTDSNMLMEDCKTYMTLAKLPNLPFDHSKMEDAEATDAMDITTLRSASTQVRRASLTPRPLIPLSEYGDYTSPPQTESSFATPPDKTNTEQSGNTTTQTPASIVAPIHPLHLLKLNTHQPQSTSDLHCLTTPNAQLLSPRSHAELDMRRSAPTMRDASNRSSAQTLLHIIKRPVNLLKYFDQQKLFATMEDDGSSVLSEKSPEVFAECIDILGLYVSRPVLHLLCRDVEERAACDVRPITALYINVTPVNNDDESPAVLHMLFILIHKFLLRYSGTLTNITPSKQGMCLLVVFGMPGIGLDYEKNSQRALMCAWRLWVEVATQFNIGEVSIGIASGPAFCGAMGPHKRMEYSVLGSTLNRAAYFMTCFPGKIICDSKTYLNSKLVNRPFKVVPRPEMKDNPAIGIVYEIVYISFYDADFKLPIYSYPILGRDKEYQIFEEMYLYDPPFKHFIVYFAGKGCGKTRLLSDIYVKSRASGLRVICMGIKPDMDLPPYAIMGRLLRAILDECGFSHQIERDPNLIRHLSVETFMDDIYHMQPMLNCKVRSTDFTDDIEHQKEMLTAILTTATIDVFKLVVIIDNAHIMDKESWQCLSVMLDIPNILTVLSAVPDSSVLSKSAKQVINHKNTARVKVAPMETEYLCSLACQMMEVRSIPQRIHKLMVDHSGGSPHWIEQFLLDLQQTGVIARISRSEELSLQGRKSVTKANPGDQYVTGATGSHASNIEKAFSYIIRDEKMVPTVPISITEMIDAQIDNLTSDEKIVVKWASVFGNVFNRRVLMDILPYSIKIEKRNKIVNSLIRQDVFLCSGIDEGYVHVVKDNQQCCNCDHIRFKNRLIRDTIHELLLPNQRAVIHNKAALCFESMSMVHKNRVPYYLLSAKVCSPADVLAMTNTQAEDPASETLTDAGLAKDDIPIPSRLPDRLGWNKKTCTEISLCLELYDHILYHWRLANRRDKVIETLVESVSAAIALKSDDLASTNLKILRSELLLVSKDPSLSHVYNQVCCVVHRLQAQIYMLNGEQSLVESECFMSLIRMGYKNIHNERGSKLINLIMTYQLRLKVNYPLLYRICSALNVIGRTDESADVLEEERIRIFTMLYHMSTVSHNDQEATFYACHLFKLSHSQKCSIHFFIECYAIITDSLYAMELPEVALKLEMELYNTCKARVDELFPDDFANLAVIFGNRSILGFMRDNSLETLKFARLSTDIYVNLHDNGACFDILPKLIRAELRANVSCEVTKIGDEHFASTRAALSLLKSLSQKLNNPMSRATYFSSVIDILIDAGVAMESIVDLITYADIKARDVTSNVRLCPQLTNVFVGLAHWYGRQKNWVMADMWYQRYVRLVHSLNHSPHCGNSLAKIIEFNLIKYAAHFKSMSLQEKEIFESYIDAKIDAMSVVIGVDKALEPRAFHLDAYWHAIRGLTNITQYDVIKSFKLAMEQNNKLEVELLRLHVKHWTAEENIMLIHHPFAWPLPSIMTFKLRLI